MRILGVDWGDRKMGVSISDPMGIVATGVEVFFGDEEEKIKRLKEIIEKFHVEVVVLGFPISLSGEIGKEAKKILKIKERLEKELNVKVELVDERFTTKIANTPISKTRDKKKRRKKVADDLSSAIIILNTYLERLR